MIGHTNWNVCSLNSITNKNIPYITGHSTPGILQISGVLACTRRYNIPVDTIHRGYRVFKIPGVHTMYNTRVFNDDHYDVISH